MASSNGFHSVKRRRPNGVHKNAVPDDDKLWLLRRSGLTEIAASAGCVYDSLCHVARVGGWKWSRREKGFSAGPCRLCGETREIKELEPDRTCKTCRDNVAGSEIPQWKRDLEWARERRRARDE